MRSQDGAFAFLSNTHKRGLDIDERGWSKQELMHLDEQGAPATTPPRVPPADFKEYKQELAQALIYLGKGKHLTGSLRHLSGTVLPDCRAFGRLSRPYSSR